MKLEGLFEVTGSCVLCVLDMVQHRHGFYRRLIGSYVWPTKQCCLTTFTIILAPRVGPGHPLVHSLLHLLLFFTFPLFLFSFALHIFLFCPSLPFPFYQNSPTPFPGPKSQKATEPGFSLFMVALCNRETIYIFMLFLLSSSSFFFFPRLISAVGDWMFTILWHMVWP